MHYWRLLLITFLATLAIAQADRLLVYGERRLLHDQERFCGKEPRGLARDTRSTSDGARNEPAIHRERFDARTVNNRDNIRRTAADRRSLDRDEQRLTQIRSAEDRSLNNQIRRERSAERARELRTVRDFTRRESVQRFSRDVRQNTFERLQRTQRDQTRESQRLTEPRRTREIHGKHENYIRSTLAHQLIRERVFTNSRGRSSEMTRRVRENINEQRNREIDTRLYNRDTERIDSRSRQNDNSRSRSFEMTRSRERDNLNEQRDSELNIRQRNRITERIASRSRQIDNRIFTNSRSRSAEMTGRERENKNQQRDREINTRQFNRNTERIASRYRPSDNRIESRENSPRDRNYESRPTGSMRIDKVDRSSIRHVRNLDAQRGNHRFTREERDFVRVQSNDRRSSDARVRQESQKRTNERNNERNTETNRVRITERVASRQMDKHMTAPIFERVKLGNWQSTNQKDEETQMSLLTYFFYTLQGVYICSVLFHLAGFYKNEKKNDGYLQKLTSGVGKEIKVD